MTTGTHYPHGDGRAEFFEPRDFAREGIQLDEAVGLNTGEVRDRWTATV